MDTEHKVIATGTIRGPEAGGEAALIRTVDGDLLQLSDYWIAEGAPDVRVYLSPDKAGSVIIEGALDFGRITCLSGQVSYAIPQNYPTMDVKTVVVHCTRFHVTFGVAVLEHV